MKRIELMTALGVEDDEVFVAPACLRVREPVACLFRLSPVLFVLLLFEAVVLLVLKRGPFEHYRPAIEPLLLHAVWATVCLFCITSRNSRWQSTPGKELAGVIV